MVFRVDSDYTSSSAASAPTQSSPLTANSSLASDEDLEGGYSSQEDNVNHCIPEHDVAMVSKFITSGKGKAPRRRSQCEQLSFRQRQDLLDGAGRRNSDGNSTSISAPATQPASFKRWSSIMTSSNGDLPKTIQFYPSDSEYLSASAPSCHKKQRSPFLVMTSIALLALTATVFVQQSQISSLFQEAEITNQHRAYLERSQSNLLSQLNARDSSLDQYRHTHVQMTKVSHDMSESMLKLREEYKESLAEVERLREIEKRVTWSEGRWEKYVGGIGEESKRGVIEKYGNGPHQVELTLQLPSTSPQATSSPGYETIKIDLAPLDMMPHSVHAFLEQVDMGAWDDTAFNIHAGHVLMAHSSSYAGKEDDVTQQVAIPTVSFPEYNAEYPHDKYTVAFPAASISSSSNNASGVDFYINLQHNTRHHSPRIDNEGSDNEQYVEGEPCFGKISDEASRMVVDRMDALRVKGHGGMLEEAVMIKSARIVGR